MADMSVLGTNSMFFLTIGRTLHVLALSPTNTSIKIMSLIRDERVGVLCHVRTGLRSTPMKRSRTSAVTIRPPMWLGTCLPDNIYVLVEKHEHMYAYVCVCMRELLR